jgi:putative SOS response-associated peptidase YedK
MCNRFNLQDPPNALAFLLEALRAGFKTANWDLEPRYNVAPQSLIPVVAQAAGLTDVRPMVWGLMPAEVRQRPGQKFYTNATAEKSRVWSGFKQSTAKRRCLIPANGYYEWQDIGGVKYPHLFTLKDGSPMALAGIWEKAAGATPETVAILTTAPNPLAATIHNRMPVVLTGDTLARWIGDEPLADPEFAALTAPIANDLLTERPVNRFVSSSRNEGPKCIAPPDPVARDPQLELL